MEIAPWPSCLWKKRTSSTPTGNCHRHGSQLLRHHRHLQRHDDGDALRREAPAAVNNFVILASLGFYDGTPVNEVTPEQALIMGAPENVPDSDAGYYFNGELNSTRTWNLGALAFLPTQNPLTGE